MVPIDDSSILISTSVRSIQELPLPPGFRFHPTDDELMWYLRKQASSEPSTFRVIATVNLYDFDPWDLPGKALFGEKEWYFFTPRNRKYPNGNRPNRRAKSGYWKATGADKLIYMPNSNNRGPTKVGVKRSLVFYQGKAPKGDKTDWIMHEYILTEDITQPSPPLPRCGSPRLNKSVLCRIRQKIPSQAQRAAGLEQERESMLTSAMANLDEQRATDFPAEDNLYSVAVTSETNTFPLTMPNISCATTFAAPEVQDTRAMPNIWNPHHAIASTGHVMPERSGPALHYNMHHPELQCYPPLSSSSFTDPSHYGGTYFMSPASQLPCFSDEVESQVQYYGGNANELPFTSVDNFLPTDQSTDPTPGEMHSFSYGHAPGPNHFS